ncbi:2-hydroxy-3-oxopropionate reductase [soil metagenome]
MSRPLEKQRIGFIGLGLIGRPMAEHLHAAGAEVVLYNRSHEVMDELAEQGMQPVANPAAVAHEVAEGILCLSLPRTESVEQVLIHDGMLEAIAPGTLVIDFGTTSVAATRRFADLVARRGAAWVDAPVSGGQVGARAASLTIMAGGEITDYERACCIFTVVGAKSTHLGKTGSGQVAKLANQLIVSQTIDAVAQALAMSEAAGVDSGKVREALRGGFAESRILELHGDRMVHRNFQPGGRAELQLKDVRLIVDLVTELGLDFPTLRNSLHQWETMVNERGLGALDHSGLFRLYVPEDR